MLMVWFSRVWGCSISLWLSSLPLYTGGYECKILWQTLLSTILLDFSAPWLWTCSSNRGKQSRERYARWRTLKNFPFLPKKMKTDETTPWNINWFSQSSYSCLSSAINIFTIQPSKSLWSISYYLTPSLRQHTKRHKITNYRRHIFTLKHHSYRWGSTSK